MIILGRSLDPQLAEAPRIGRADLAQRITQLIAELTDDPDIATTLQPPGR